jgi:hypothetical protein
MGSIPSHADERASRPFLCLAASHTHPAGRCCWAGLTDSVSLPLAGVEQLERNIRRDPVHDPEQQPRALSFTVVDECGATTRMLPLMDVLLEQYTVYFRVGPSSFEPCVPAPASLRTTMAGDVGDFVLAAGASVTANGAAQNLRTGDPGQVSSAALAPAFRDSAHHVSSVTFQVISLKIGGISLSVWVALLTFTSTVTLARLALTRHGCEVTNNQAPFSSDGPIHHAR